MNAEHQLQDGALAKSVGNDLEAPALLDEQAFKQIRGADRATMRHREPQVGDAGSKSSMKQATPRGAYV